MIIGGASQDTWPLQYTMLQDLARWLPRMIHWEW
ncbi:UNVERIFIED_CONTAM: hypothetical protein GTU68_005904 [Idotea baltica]|nr:hypothetical protein [Idotea baltica]